jgi:predicted dehydrogenase
VTLRTAIIGMGRMGGIRKAELDRHPEFEVVALCDSNPEMISHAKDVPFYTTWQAALEQPLDVVVVCTFNKFAPEIVCAALAKGCHVFCEKPPGRTVADVEAIQRAERAAPGKVLKFGFNHRFHYAVMEAKSIVESKQYGEILFARGVYGKAGGVNFSSSWRCDEELAGGGILLDQGIHMLDLLRYFMGDFSEVKSFVENLYWKSSTLEDNAFALLRTPSGQVAMMHSSATQWRHRFNLDLYMTDGYLTIQGILSSTRSYGDESITYARKQFEDASQAFGRPREETIYFDRDDSWRLEIEELYECISGKRETVEGNSRDAREVMVLIDRIYHSGK